MPIYEFKCDVCKAEREALLSVNERGKKPKCECGETMRRKFSLAHFTMPKTGRDKVLSILNQEKDALKFPGGPKYRPRYEQAMSKSLDQTRPVIGRGF